MSVSPKKQEQYISEQVESGDFQNASEVVRDALRLHEFYRHCIIQDLKTEIEKGWSDKISSSTGYYQVQKGKQIVMSERFYILSEIADQDLEEIFDYSINKFGFEQAEKYLLEPEEVFQALVMNPYSGKKRNEVKSG
ncbi:type II toxin-antitoxin system RelE/ParE family toxin [uncultured Chryseobacterium sp.]|uniref:type II toxin-antitoxin system RelE/ParE family toxin n=1 Tax=uncultured Chryseobacterium sp. TaxID=259322 RepID=UPI00342BDC4D